MSRSDINNSVSHDPSPILWCRASLTLVIRVEAGFETLIDSKQGVENENVYDSDTMEGLPTTSSVHPIYLFASSRTTREVSQAPADGRHPLATWPVSRRVVGGYRSNYPLTQTNASDLGRCFAIILLPASFTLHGPSYVPVVKCSVVLTIQYTEGMVC